MTREEFQALVDRDEADILDILKTTTKSLTPEESLIMMQLQLKMLCGFCYWTADLYAAFLGGWDSDAWDADEEEPKYDA